jgi:hypothetical protein
MVSIIHGAYQARGNWWLISRSEFSDTTSTFAVYDVQGRLVTRWRATVGAGGIVTWNGRGSDGRRVGSGIYLVRGEIARTGPR